MTPCGSTEHHATKPILISCTLWLITVHGRFHNSHQKQYHALSNLLDERTVCTQEYLLYLIVSLMKIYPRSCIYAVSHKQEHRKNVVPGI